MYSCLHQHCRFSLFNVSVYGLLCVEAEATIKLIVIRLATKWNHPHLLTCGYVKSRVAITLVCATHRFIRESRFSMHTIGIQ